MLLLTENRGGDNQLPRRVKRTKLLSLQSTISVLSAYPCGSPDPLKTHIDTNRVNVFSYPGREPSTSAGPLFEDNACNDVNS